LFELADSIKTITILISPFTPETAEKIAKHFKFDLSLEEIDKPLDNLKIKKSPILFQKIETAVKTDVKPNLNKQEEPKEIMEGITTINFEDFAKIDLRVAEILKIEDIPGADKLYKLTLSVGELGKRTICAGIKQFYSHDDLKGKKIIIIANLSPRKLKGIESCGMLLAASTKDKKTISLISPDSDMPSGSTVG
jgi:methionyl-tRNA synthetase